MSISRSDGDDVGLGIEYENDSSNIHEIKNDENNENDENDDYRNDDKKTNVNNNNEIRSENGNENNSSDNNIEKNILERHILAKNGEKGENDGNDGLRNSFRSLIVLFDNSYSWYKAKEIK